jgi:NADPH:quinone reductase-like Zn-dependent oxidoreductase
MKAVRFHSLGGIDVLKYEQPAQPTAGPGEVIVNLKAAALNHLDLWVRSGARERNIPLPHIPGSDGAGVLAEVGRGAEYLREGEKVLISPGISCGHCKHCIGGSDNLCRSYHVLGTTDDGTYAEFVKVPAANVVPIPEGMDFNQAASVPLVFLTAWHMLVTLAKIRPGEFVLVHSAGSGVGIAGIQIAHLFGARIIATAGTEKKLLKAKDLGAEHLINYNEKDFVEEVRRITEKQGVDAVFEHNGGELFEKSIQIITKGGRIVTCGATSDYQAKLDLRYVYSRHIAVHGSFLGTKKELLDVLQFFPSGDLKPVIDSVFPLRDAADAQKKMEERKHFGKIVLSI